MINWTTQQDTTCFKNITLCNNDKSFFVQIYFVKTLKHIINKQTPQSHSQKICLLYSLKGDDDIWRNTPLIPIMNQAYPDHTSHCISIRNIFMLSYHKCHGLQSGLLS